MSEHDELEKILSQQPTKKRDECPAPSRNGDKAMGMGMPPAGNAIQWAIGPNGNFIATSATCPFLPAGVYRVGESKAGIVYSRAAIVTDKLIDLKDSASNEIIEGIRTFWNSQERFAKYGMLYKRGVLLWGPPGSGKTVTVSLLIKELVAEGGMVILCEQPGLAVLALAEIRRIEPERRLIVVEEDIEEMLRQYGEHALLALLDGENQIANVVHVATTNFPEELGARIINRPSRFDEVKKIGMPNTAAREAYFEATVPKPFPSDELRKWVRDTDGLSIAHLRELVVAVYCLERGYDETLERLKKMQIRPKTHEDGWRRREEIGMGGGFETGVQSASASSPRPPGSCL